MYRLRPPAPHCRTVDRMTGDRTPRPTDPAHQPLKDWTPAQAAAIIRRIVAVDEKQVTVAAFNSAI